MVSPSGCFVGLGLLTCTHFDHIIRLPCLPCILRVICRSLKRSKMAIFVHLRNSSARAGTAIRLQPVLPKVWIAALFRINEAVSVAPVGQR